MPRISKYKRKDSDRSGFQFYEIELVKDGPWKVAGDEFDTPPPSRLPLGGEGDISSGDIRQSGSQVSDTNTPADVENPTVLITAAGGITPVFTHPWMRISGSGSNLTITATPNIVRGQQDQLLTLECVGSSVTLTHGSANAINFMDSRGTLRLDSGMVLTMIFNSGNAAWNESSRYRPSGG